MFDRPKMSHHERLVYGARIRAMTFEELAAEYMSLNAGGTFVMDRQDMISARMWEVDPAKADLFVPF